MNLLQLLEEECQALDLLCGEIAINGDSIGKADLFLFLNASIVPINRGATVNQQPGRGLGTSSQGSRIPSVIFQLNMEIPYSAPSEPLLSKGCDIFPIKKKMLSNDNIERQFIVSINKFCKYIMSVSGL